MLHPQIKTKNDANLLCKNPLTFSIIDVSTLSAYVFNDERTVDIIDFPGFQFLNESLHFVLW